MSSVAGIRLVDSLKILLACLCLIIGALSCGHSTLAGTGNRARLGMPDADSETTPATNVGAEAPDRESNQGTPNQDKPRGVNADLKGWDYLYNLLIKEGIGAQELEDIFSSPKMPKWERVSFNVKPKEPHTLYRKHNTASARENAISFYKLHREEFLKAEREYGVPSSIVLAILQVESHCGKYTGQAKIFYRLARLAGVGEPRNIEDNIDFNRKIHKVVSREDVEKRAKRLEETFLPHLVDTIRLSKKMGVHPLELKGSSAGAMGLPQFLPGNIQVYGVDSNGDGKIDLYEPGDAIHSVANFLARMGWDTSSKSLKKSRDILFEYNQSEPYVDTVIAMAEKLAEKIN